MLNTVSELFDLLYYRRTRSTSGRAKIEPRDYKYRAFISYSHKDEKWAAWLHRSLETFRVPTYLVGESTSMGIVPERMGKVFRDREELSSSHSLGTELTQALEDSACQIVICSPNAVNSHWTNQEILTYKRLGRGGPCRVGRTRPLPRTERSSNSNRQTRTSVTSGSLLS
jgi:hypothetical protein